MLQKKRGNPIATFSYQPPETHGGVGTTKRMDLTADMELEYVNSHPFPVPAEQSSEDSTPDELVTDNGKPKKHENRYISG
jgi:hypothetical protein